MKSAEEALSFIVNAIADAGYKPGDDVVLAIDAASSEFYENGKYEMRGEGKSYTSAQMVEFYKGLCDKFPIFSIEDGMAEDDWEGWKMLTDTLGDRIQLVGDDLFDDLHGAFRGALPVNFIIDHHHRGKTAGAEAADRLDGEKQIGTGPFVRREVQPLVQGVEQPV